MFEDLSRRLDGVLGRFRKRGLLTERMIQDGLREIRRALLEADVNYRVTRDFLNCVREKAMGERGAEVRLAGAADRQDRARTRRGGADRRGRGDPAQLVPGASHGDHAGGVAGVGEDGHRGQTRQGG